MAIFRSQTDVLAGDGRSLGFGMVYLHLPRGLEQTQTGSGTVSLTSWEPVEDPPAVLRLADGRHLAIRVSRDALSECSRNRILRFAADWPPGSAAEPG